jgi:1-deoxy-D-xylulose-5-phosphate reductoisomerase
VKRIIVLGSTGSIGESTLAVAREMPEELRVVGLACRSQAARLAAQAAEFRPEAIALGEEEAARGMKPCVASTTRLYEGEQGTLDMIREVEADIVVNGISGAAGLLPSVAALRAGKDLALANKESMVMAGSFLRAEAEAAGRRILPVDSEHAALFGLLEGQNPSEVAELILTASGGALRGLSDKDLAHVRLADALRHPTWKMGAKITVDCASMANKGLEVIEAHGFFSIDMPRIKVLIHPESRVHSLLRTVDGTLHAQISTPDMRTPIQNALTYPALKRGKVEWLDLAGSCLTFQAVDMRRYRMLALAYQAAELSAFHPVIFNAANEVAVAWFMKDAIPFMAIAQVVEEALGMEWGSPCASIDGVLAVDREARRRVAPLLKRFCE